MKRSKRSPKPQELPKLQETIGYTFADSNLLRLALTHPSVTHNRPDSGENNQRLEFLGDAVLQLCVTEELYSRFPDKDEGDLTQMRVSLVCGETLAEAAQSIGLGRYLYFDIGEEKSGGRDKPSVLADAMEALIAAVYLDGGLEAAKSLCELVLRDYSKVRIVHNWKSQLQEFEQRNGRESPVYHIVAEEGLPHERVFHAEAWLSGVKRGEGKGYSKKEAEQDAARSVLDRVMDDPE